MVSISNQYQVPDFLMKTSHFSSHLWVALSAMYGKLLVLLMVAFCLIEVMDNQVKPLTFQVI